MTYDITFLAYGDNRAALECRDPEVLLIGPAETGKTFALLNKLHMAALKHKDASLVILRKTLASTYSTVLRTFTEKVLRDFPAVNYGGEKPEWFQYPNGARIWVTGLDKASKILSAEHDIIYCNQAEELTLDEWETLTTRTTGRAGHMPYSQTIGDANPTYPQHWMYQRASIRRFFSWHKDNPTLYSQAKEQWTAQGERTTARLSALTGARRTRLFIGQPVQPEGAVYAEYDPGMHLVDWFQPPPEWRRFRVVDFGYTNPFVCHWWAVDSDGRMYMYREIYRTQRLVEDHAKDIVRLSEGENVEATVCDTDAEDRATLERHGVPTMAAMKDVSPGIQTVEARLKRAGDGRPRLFVMRDALVERDPNLEVAHLPLCTADEFPAYIWQKVTEGKTNKEEPLKVNDHGMDAMRYGVMYMDEYTGSWITLI